MSLTVADNIASVLRRHGVQRVFGQGIPSGLVLAEERYGVHVTLYRTEIAGGAMADGYSRISQRVGVVVTQGGPGATLLVSPLAEAFRASTPLLALVQDLPRSNRDRNAFQDFDYEALFDSCTKWICRLDNPARIETDTRWHSFVPRALGRGQ